MRFQTEVGGTQGGEGRTGRLSKVRRHAPLILLAVGLAVEIALIHGLSAHGNFLQKGEAWKFTGIGIGAGLAYWIAARCFAQVQIPAHQRVYLFWSVAVILRMMIFSIAPGDDVWRYRWEGMIQLHGFNPYRSSPESLELADLKNSDWAKINHREYPAIYPPVNEAIFAAVAAAGNSLWIYKAVFALADLAGIAVLWRLLLRTGSAAERAAWYAWNPLVVYTSAGAAHFDSLMVLALLLAISALDRCAASLACPDKTAVRRIPAACWFGALFLGMAIAIKIAPVVLLPVWMFALRSWRRVFILLPVVFAPLAVGAMIYGFPWVPVFSTLQRFGNTFRVNDPFWWIVDALRWSNPAQDNVLYGAFGGVACAAVAYGFRNDWQRGLLWVWGIALLLSPVVHAWYLIWVLPVAAWRGEDARAWFVFSITIFAYFLLWEVNHASGKAWEEPLWLRLTILSPPLIYLAWAKGMSDSANIPVETV